MSLASGPHLAAVWTEGRWRGLALLLCKDGLRPRKEGREVQMSIVGRPGRANGLADLQAERGEGVKEIIFFFYSAFFQLYFQIGF